MFLHFSPCLIPNFSHTILSIVCEIEISEQNNHLNSDSTMTDHAESLSPATPAFRCHPLDLLDIFLKDLEATLSDGDKNKIDEILRAADFLAGTSIMEGALNILDAPTTIRLLQSPNRSAFIVRGEESYYCSKEIIYCSCRSFLERAKADPHTLCKHLLALKLMPHLNVTPVTETVSDVDFGKIVMLRVFVDESIVCATASSSSVPNDENPNGTSQTSVDKRDLCVQSEMHT